MSAFKKFEELVKRLDKLRVPYDIKHVREGSLLIVVATPGKRWEVEVMEDGSLEVEIFISSGVRSTKDLAELYRELQ